MSKRTKYCIWILFISMFIGAIISLCKLVQLIAILLGINLA